MDQVLLNGMYTALYAEHLLKRAHKAIQKWSAKMSQYIGDICKG